MVVVTGPDCHFHWGSISFITKIILLDERKLLLVGIMSVAD